MFFFLRSLTFLFSTFFLTSTLPTHIAAAGDTAPLILGTSADYPPFESIHNGDIVGFDIDLIQALETRLGQKIILQDMDFNALMPALSAGKIDIAIGGITPTPERAKTVDFSRVYYQNKMMLLSKTSAPIAEKTALSHKRLGVQLGSRYDTVAASWKAQIPTLTVHARARVPQLVEELKAGHIDAVLLPDVVAKRIAKEDLAALFTVADLPNESSDQSAIAFKKGAPLVALIDQHLTALAAEGGIDALVEKWIAPQPPTTQGIQTSTTTGLSTFLYILKGVLLTLEYTAMGLIGGLCLAIPLLFAKLSTCRSLRTVANLYTSLFRGTPLLVQLCIIYYGLPGLIGIHLPGFVAAALTFSLNSAAYVSEILLGGVRSIDPGQGQAATALGLSHTQTMRHILLPQTCRNVAPALLNEMIDLLKESSLVSVIGEADIMRRAQLVSAQSYDYMAPLMMAASCYYVLVLGLGQGARYLTKARKK